jgi:F-box and leucine-rich repeat protein GRR1
MLATTTLNPPSAYPRFNSPQDLLNCMCVNRSWARNAVQKLWHRPGCTSWDKHRAICRTLGEESPLFNYKDFIKRLNLANLSERVNDGSVVALSVCTQVERLTLTNCEGLTDQGLIGLVTDSRNLLALDISGDVQITEISINVLAEHCKKLQGLNITNCVRISNDAMIKVAQSCRFIKRASQPSHSSTQPLTDHIAAQTQ